ncbi:MULTISPECIES: hypothetical protein [Sphingomonas]|uniref:hypothetical protein n=1 Tax=Sphingomonas TaxID=13687 RepID=UPI001269C28F|nr:MULTISPECIES: hypothetical protein [Sphingomonas]
MIGYIFLAALMQSTSSVPIHPLCAGGGVCTPPPVTPETQAEAEARKSAEQALEAQVYAPLRSGRTDATCASARQLAATARRPDMIAAINALCAVPTN